MFFIFVACYKKYKGMQKEPVFSGLFSVILLYSHALRLGFCV